MSTKVSLPHRQRSFGTSGENLYHIENMSSHHLPSGTLASGELACCYCSAELADFAVGLAVISSLVVIERYRCPIPMRSCCLLLEHDEP